MGSQQNCVFNELGEMAVSRSSMNSAIEQPKEGEYQKSAL
jgi:hypothetical protein